MLDERAGRGANDSAPWTTRFFELRASDVVAPTIAGAVAGAVGGASASASAQARRSIYLAFWPDEGSSRVATPTGVVVVDGTSALERIVRTGAARHGEQSGEQRAIALRHATRAGSIELYSHSESESAAWWSKLSAAIADCEGGAASASASASGTRESAKKADGAEEEDEAVEEDEEETTGEEEEDDDDEEDDEDEEEEEEEEEEDAEPLEVMAEEDEDEDESVSSDSTGNASPNAPRLFRASDTVLQQRGDEAVPASAAKCAADSDSGDSDRVLDVVAMVFHVTGYTRTSEVTMTMSRHERASTSIRALLDRLAADVHVRCLQL